MSTEAVSRFEPTVIGAFRRYWRFVFAVVIVTRYPGRAVRLHPARGLYGQGLADRLRTRADRACSAGRILPIPAGTSPTSWQCSPARIWRLASSARAKTLKPPLDESPGWFLAHVSASGSATNNNVISVAVKGSSAAQAKAAADAVVSAYSDVVKQSMAAQASAIRDQLDTSIASIDDALAQLTGHTDAASLAQIQQLIANRSPLDSRRAQVASEALHPSAGISFVLLPNGAQSSGRSAAARSLLLAIVVGALLGLAPWPTCGRTAIVCSRTTAIPRASSAHRSSSTCRALPLVDILGRAAPKERQVSRLAQLFGAPRELHRR